MIRHTAHRHAVALSQRHVQQSRGLLRIIEKHLVEISEPKQQERVCRNAFSQPLVLLHHRSERVLHNEVYLATSIEHQEMSGLWVFIGNTIKYNRECATEPLGQ